MSPPSRSMLSTFWTAPIVLAVLSSCQGAGPVRVREAFDKISPGMCCREVEAMLGEPVLRFCTVVPPLVGDDEAWYLPPPELEVFESPWGPGTICVVYGVDNRVVSKQLNPQWSERSGALANKPMQPAGAQSGAGG